MPFVSEELFQRLPRADQVASICVASYPTVASSPWRNETLEKEVDFVQKAARIIRSARSDYNIPNKTKTDAFVVCTDEASRQIIGKFSADLATTAYCGTIVIDAAEIPVGCAILTISGQCVVHLMLKGLIDADKEMVKLQKKKDQLEQVVVKLTQSMAATDYAVKVPVDVQQANVEKLTASQSEIERVAGAMENLKLM